MALTIDKNTKWIWLPAKEFARNHFVEFRKLIELETVDDATFIIAADTSYQLWINEQLVSDGYFSEHPDDRYYHTVDVSSYLQPGKNCIAIVGCYQGVNTSRYVAGRPGILFALWSGGKCFLKSDSECRARTSLGYLSGDVPFVTVQLGLTLQYDASKDDDWKAMDYDDSFWDKAVEISDPQEFSKNGLKPYPLKNFQRSYKQAPVISNGLLQEVPKQGSYADMISGADLEKSDDHVGRYSITLQPSSEGSFVIFDLQRETCGYLQIEIEAEEYTVIDIAHGEHIIDGRVRAKIETRNFADRYIASKGHGCWSMPVRKLGCRYIELHVRNTAGMVRVNAVGLNAIEYPTNENRAFQCDDELIEKIHEVSRRTAKLCMLENYSDTPWREQSLYSQDAANQALCGYYLFGEYDYPEKCLRLLGNGRFDDKYLVMCSPSDLPITIPCFTMVWVTAIRDFTLYSGSMNLAQEFFCYIENFIKTMLSELQEGVLVADSSEAYWNFYEWSEGLDEGGPFAKNKKEKFHICKTLFLLDAIYAYNDICQYLHKDSFVKDEDIVRIVEGINNKFYIPEKGLYANEHPCKDNDVFSELTQVMACSLMPIQPDQIRRIKEHIGLGNHLVPSTLSMRKYVFEAYDKMFNDHGKTTLELIQRDWGYMLSQGATSFWETIKGEADFNGAGSLCHGWSIIPIYYIYATIIGVRPLEPGFKCFTLSPSFGDFNDLKAAIPTPYGAIRIWWHRKGDRFELEIEYPSQIKMVNDIDDRYCAVLNAKSYESTEKEKMMDFT